MRPCRILVLATLSVFIWIEGYSQETKNYVSFAGGFEVNLPRNVRGHNGMGSGMRMTWRQPEAEYEIGFHQRQGLPLAYIEGQFSYEEAVRRYFNKFSSDGESIYVKAALLQKNPGFEYKFKTRNSIFILRLFLVGDRVYQLLAQIPIAIESNEQKVLQVFDSVKLISADDTARHFAKQIADATPKTPPQDPKVHKYKSDIQDRNLKGSVKSIKYEFAGYALNDSLKQKYITLYEEFDRDGNLTKAIDHDSQGSPLKVTVYGYVSGRRVSRIGSIEQEGSFFGILIEFPSGSRLDNRFDQYFTFKYLNGMLAEESTFWSNGVRTSRATYRFLKNTKITSYFDGGRAFRRIVANLDDKGNEIKLTNFEPDGGKWQEQSPFDIKYDTYDQEGNWTQRSSSRCYGLGEKCKKFPEYVEYRSIEYYQ